KDMGKQAEARDTLYFNAFTEDLFHWNNDLVGDEDRRLLLNRDSRFFQGLFDLEMDNRIRPLLRRYAD
ncbi:anticodon nuclease, partial [Vibrio parahaemolyticus]